MDGFHGWEWGGDEPMPPRFRVLLTCVGIAAISIAAVLIVLMWTRGT